VVRARVWAVGEDDRAPDERPGKAALLDQVSRLSVVKYEARDRDPQRVPLACWTEALDREPDDIKVVVELTG
jgi:hypothetical protein